MNEEADFVPAEEKPFDSVTMSLNRISIEVYGAHIVSATGERGQGFVLETPRYQIEKHL